MTNDMVIEVWVSQQSQQHAVHYDSGAGLNLKQVNIETTLYPKNSDFLSL